MAANGHWARQGVLYAAVGGAQLCLDWALFSLLYATTGASVLPNLAGRTGGALLGFALNSRYTFGASGALHGQRLRRFAILWLLQTVVSTVLVWAAARWLAPGWVYAAKPLIEVGLAVAGFLAWRYWIQRV
jgi:putative flippase GtrA